LNSAEQNEGHRQHWCSFSSCSWVGGWVDGWVEVKAVLRIAYSNQKKFLWNGKTPCKLEGNNAGLAKAFVIHPRDSISNLSSDRKYFLILFVSHLNPNLLGVDSWALFVNILVHHRPIKLDPIKACCQKPLNTICMWRGTI
jgi:hypothetical protein